ncbi:MAG: hypothetical protein HWN65_13835 [Candidatus Helarchaeota archaeon]|nr:hypothetical protein [Candidatus Helarchaeota archaeon]
MLENIFVQIFANPWVLYILLMLGLYFLLVGVASGEGEMTVVAVICLGLSIFGVIIRGIDLASVILFIVGVVLFVAEAETEGSLDGLLAIGGIICVISGGVTFLQNLSVLIPADQIVIMWATLLTFTITLAVLFGGITLKLIQLKKKEATDKFVPEQGDVGVVKSSELKPDGQVTLGGEVWSAECIEGHWPVLKGERVKVLKIEGVHLIVRPLIDEEDS